MLEWQGEGWYTVRMWRTDNNCWDSPEQPDAYWYEGKDEFDEACRAPEGFEAVMEYFGDGTYPDEPVNVADCYDDFDYERWDAIRDAVSGETLKDACEFIAHENAGRTHAGFRALRESIGFSQADVALECGVQERTVRRWETPRNKLAPADAWWLLEHMQAVFAKGVAAAVAQVADIAEEAGRPPKDVKLTYYRSQEQYDELGPDDGSFGFCNAMTREVARKLRQSGIAAEIKYVDE